MDTTSPIYDPSDSFIVFNNVSKEYKAGEVVVKALDNVSFAIRQGELVIMLGASGAGKSTALNILGGMEQATSGQIIVDGYIISDFNSASLTEYRRNNIGFVFQFYNLIQNLTAKENIELATEICTNTLDPVEILTQVGLAHRIDNFPSQLSGGEQQRVSIARALAKNPKILLCDEPTGALDYNTSKQVLGLLQRTCYEKGITTVIITHNNAIAPMGNRIIQFKSGQITHRYFNPQPMPVEQIEW